MVLHLTFSMSLCGKYYTLLFQCLSVVSISVIPINRLIGDLTIFTPNIDDQSQFLKTNF